MKYKVGDKVRVRKDLEIGKRYYMADGKEHDAFVWGMEPYRGRVVTITEAPAGKYRIGGDRDYNWVDEMFEGLAEQPKIVITTDGGTTLARLYEGKRVVKRAEAKCSPSDAFDFMTGAKLALERLAAESEPEPAAPTYAEGDIVRVVQKGGEPYHCFAIGTVAKVLGLYDRHTLELRANGFRQYVNVKDVEKINF